ncbi:MAG: energy transducer TonB [Moraxellaceae bacterium]|nr:energy transducer TonB [Moraxellaceae bacterium]
MSRLAPLPGRKRSSRQLIEFKQSPRKKFVGARTQEYRFAQYVEDWRTKIERLGTLHFPKSNNGKLYGSVLLSTEIAASGEITALRVERSSGQAELDRHALCVAYSSSPMPAFTPEMQKDTDILVITRTWTFTNERVPVQP